MTGTVTPEEQIAKSIVPYVTTHEDEMFWKQFGSVKVNSRARHRLYKGELHWQKVYWRKLKTEVLTHYGGGKLACVKCGFLDFRALSLDHIHGGGREERGNSSQGFFLRLKREGYPEGYQTLCMNCQFIKRYENNELSRADS